MNKFRKKIEEKIGYNLSEFIYTSAYISIVLIIVIASYANRPQKFTDNNETFITCENRRVYKLKSNDLYLDQDTKEFEIRYDESARKLCEYGIRRDFLNKYEVPENKNYTLTIVGTRGSYKAMFGIFFGYLALTWFFFRFIKKRFLS